MAFAWVRECNLTTMEVLAHFAAVTNPLAMQVSSTDNIPPWSVAAYQLLFITHYYFVYIEYIKYVPILRHQPLHTKMTLMFTHLHLCLLPIPPLGALVKVYQERRKI